MPWLALSQTSFVGRLDQPIRDWLSSADSRDHPKLQ